MVPPFCKQIIRPENTKLAEKTRTPSNDLVVCVNEIKMGMFAKSALFPGTNTFILNLISSFSDEGVDQNATSENTTTDADDEIDVLADNGDSKQVESNPNTNSNSNHNPNPNPNPYY